MGRRPAKDEALFLPGVRAIHTFFMRVSIDVVFLGAGGKVLRLVEGVPPGRAVRGPREAEGCLELPAGSIAGRPLAEIRFTEENGRVIARMVPTTSAGG